MRSRFIVCAAVFGFVLGAGLFSSKARAADPKGKAAAKKKSDDLADDKVIGKQLQWEDSVMGADDKRAELDKIARAQAINKAAAEKAEKEKAARAEREAKEKEKAEKAGPQTTKRGGDVALPSLPDEGPSKGSSKSGSTEISPKLDTAAAAAPPPPLKPADDKFIDKLLKEEGSGKKKKASTASNDDLIDILSGDKGAKGGATKAKRKDDVDSLLSDADKAPFMGETKTKKETPEWAKPEIRDTPTQAYVPPPPAPKKKVSDDGVIRVVQGAAGTPAAGSARPAAATIPAPRAMVATPPPPAPGRKSAAINSRPGEWADPFAEPSSSKSPRKQVAATRGRASDDLDDDIRAASAPARRGAPPAAGKREASRGSGAGDWSDPFSDSERKTTNSKRGAAPAGKSAGRKSADPASWKDPFTTSSAAPAKSSRPLAGASSKSSHGPVAMRATGPAAKTAAPRAAVARRPAVAEASEPAAKSQGRWGILRKR
jgi:hypothetical protein